MTEYRTAFRDTATIPDASGRYRTVIILAGGNKAWSDEAIANYIRLAPRPTKALKITLGSFQTLEANPDLRFGYVDAPGDVDSTFEPTKWKG